MNAKSILPAGICTCLMRLKGASFMKHDETLLRLPTVLGRTGLSRALLYRLVAEHRFPSPVKIGARAVAWRASDVAAWIETRPMAEVGGAPR